MTKRTFQLICILSSFLLIACIGNNEDSNASASTDTTTISGDIKPLSLHGNWIVHSVDEYPVAESNLPNIHFNDDGTISGSTGCNRFRGMYALDSDAITIKKVALTRRACIGNLGTQERFFTEIFTAVTNLKFDDNGHLMLMADNGRFLKAYKE